MDVIADDRELSELRLDAQAERDRRLRLVACGSIASYATVVLVLSPDGSPSQRARIAWLGMIAASLLLVGRLVRRAPRWCLGSGSLLLGFGMITVGAGVVAERAYRRMWPSDLLGLMAGVGGVVLVVLGWRHLLRRVDRRWVAVGIAVSATLVIVQLVLYPAAWALLATNRGAPPEVSGRTPADVGLVYEDVRIPSHDGVHLAAWWIPSTNGAAVVALTGSGSTRDDLLRHAALLVEGGYGVLVPDFRGHGDSPGRSMELGWGAEDDLSALVAWTLDRPDVSGRVGVHGVSLGAMVAIGAATEDPRISAVVAEGPTSRTWADARLAPDMSPLTWASWWVRFKMIELLAPEEPPRPLADAVRDARIPILMIAGDDPREQGLVGAYATGAPDHVTAWTVPDSPHALAIHRHPEAYGRRVLGLFDGALLGQPRT